MDKRWILIIIILIVGISSLYFIANDSMKIGKAINTIDNVIITLPTDFKMTEKTDSFAEISNRNNDNTIQIELIKQKNKAQQLMKDKLSELKSENVIDIKNTTQNISGLTVYTINYQNITTDTPVNYSVNFVNKLNKTFIITAFNYTDNTSQLNDITEVIKTIRLDFKVKDE